MMNLLAAGNMSIKEEWAVVSLGKMSLSSRVHAGVFMQLRKLL